MCHQSNFCFLLLLLCGAMFHTQATSVADCTTSGNLCWALLNRVVQSTTTENDCDLVHQTAHCLNLRTGCVSEAWNRLTYSVSLQLLQTRNPDYKCDLSAISTVPTDACGQDRYTCLVTYSDRLFELQNTGKGSSIPDICQAMSNYTDCWLEAPSCTFGGIPEVINIVYEEISRTRAQCSPTRLQQCTQNPDQQICNAIEVDPTAENDEYCSKVEDRLDCFDETNCYSPVQMELLEVKAKAKVSEDRKECSLRNSSLGNSDCDRATQLCVDDFVDSVFYHQIDANALCVDLNNFLQCRKDSISCVLTMRDLELIAAREQRRMRIACPSFSALNGQMTLVPSWLSLIVLVLARILLNNTQ